MILKRLSESVYCILGGEKEPNTGFVVGKSGILVIDTTFSPYHATLVLKQIRSVTQKLIRYVFCTHHHSDHTFGNQVFSAKVVACRECREIMRALLETEWSKESIQKWTDENPEWKEKLANLKITLPDVIFDEKHEIDLGNLKVSLRHLGGHTKDSSIAYIPSSKVLFAGDLIFQGRYPYTKDGDIQTWLSALKTIQDMDFKTLVPGHGFLCDKEDVKHLIEYFENLLENCERFIQENLPLAEIVKRKEFFKLARRNVNRHQENIKKVYAELTQGFILKDLS
ncbi:MAG: MBL fold metallo-hydrolase [candidate division Zixibacteria bacterium]|nr:MBL fold metallo-hydrolase [candidate division Zixibacteria bacterium]